MLRRRHFIRGIYACFASRRGHRCRNNMYAENRLRLLYQCPIYITIKHSYSLSILVSISLPLSPYIIYSSYQIKSLLA